MSYMVKRWDGASPVTLFARFKVSMMFTDVLGNTGRRLPGFGDDEIVLADLTIPEGVGIVLIGEEDIDGGDEQRDVVGMYVRVSAAVLIEETEVMLAELGNKTHVVSYRFRPADFPPGSSCGGTNAPINGEWVTLDGGADKCMICRKEMGKENKEDIRDREYIETDVGRIYIIKSRPKRLSEIADFRHLLEQLKSLPPQELLWVAVD